MIKSMLHSWLTIPIFFFFLPRYTSAYTWQFTSQPRQCQNISIAIQGSGQPPYSLVIIPSGPTPLPNNTEVRNVQNFTGSSTTLSFNFNYPENSTFVAVVSDSSGFGTGGTSAPVTVLPSSDSSCYDPTKGIQLPWVFSIDPSNGITQCESVRLWWEQETVNGTVNFYGVIPGGESFNIPQGPLSTAIGAGTGFSWTVDITGGTNILFVGGDDRGIGSGGFEGYTVGYSSNSSCLSSASPSLTPGIPAGSIFPTSTSGSSSTSNPTSTSGSPSGSSKGHSNIAAIAGGVAGGLAIVALALIAFFFHSRRRGYSTISRERPVNVLYDDEDGDVPPQGLPHHYTPQPYLVSNSTISGTAEAALARDRPVTTADTLRPQTAIGMTSTKKGAREIGSLPPRDPVNIFQHDDAGPSEWPASVGENETMIELPPAYNNIRSA